MQTRENMTKIFILVILLTAISMMAQSWKSDFSRCRMLYQTKKTDKAFTEGKRLLSKYPQEKALYYKLINTARLFKQNQDTNTYYESALQTFNHDTQLPLQYITYLKQTGAHKKISQYIKTFENHQQDHPAFYYLCGKFALAENKTDKALECFHQSIANQQEIYRSTQQLYIQYSKLKQSEKAIKAILLGLKAPKLTKSEKQRIMKLFFESQTRINIPEVQKLVRNISTFITEYRELRDFFFELHLFLQEKGIRPSFIKETKKLPASSENIDLHCFTGYLYFLSGKADAAKEQYQLYTEEEYSTGQGEFLINYLLKYEPENGIQELEKLHQKSPLPRYAITLGKLYFKKDQFIKTIEILTPIKAERLSTEEAKPYSMLMLISLAKEEKYQKIVEVYHQVPFGGFEDLWFISKEINTVLAETHRHKKLQEALENRKEYSDRTRIFEANTWQALRNGEKMFELLNQYLENHPDDYIGRKMMAEEGFNLSVRIVDKEPFRVLDLKLLKNIYPSLNILTKATPGSYGFIEKYLIASTLLEKEISDTTIYRNFPGVQADKMTLIAWAKSADKARLPDLSEQFYSRLRKRYPTDPMIQANYAIYAGNNGQLEKCLTYLETILRKGNGKEAYSPDDMTHNYGWFVMNSELSPQEKETQLRELYLRIVKDPDVPEKATILVNLLRVYTRHKQNQLTLELIEYSESNHLSIPPFELWFTAATLYFELQEYSQALQYLEKMDSLDLPAEKRAEILMNKGEIAYKMGNPEKAEVYYNRLVSEYPNDPLSVEALIYAWKIAKTAGNSEKQIKYETMIEDRKSINQRMYQQYIQEKNNEMPGNH